MTEANFHVGQRVRTAMGSEMVISAITAGGQYIGESGLPWAAADLRPIHEPAAPSPNGDGAAIGLTFQVDVSRTYRNKDGYEVSGYKLNTSFVTETHTVDSFVETVVKPGWPYTMVHVKRSPQETGAAARGVTTPKHTENFISSQLLTFDDDSKTTGIIDYWRNEPFFSRYGLAFIESVNSRLDEAEKGHVTLLLDRPITDPVEYRDCLKAFYYAQPHLDHLTNIDRTIYNAQGARVHFVGAVCPFEKFERTYLLPYRAAEREKAEAIEAERERRQQEVERARATGRKVSHSQEENYLSGYLRWMFDHVGAKKPGDNRNKSIYWAGRGIAGIEATDWAKPYLHLLADVETCIVSAAAANGYLHDHAHDDAREVLRIFERGRKAGGEPLDPPVPRPVFTANGSNRSGAAVQAQNDDGATAIRDLSYRPEDGGIMDVWHDLHGDEWIYATGFEEWYRFTGTHHQPDVGSYALKSQIATLMDTMNQQARTMRADVIAAMNQEAQSLKDKGAGKEAIKDAIAAYQGDLKKLSAYVGATSRTAARVASVEGLARLRCYIAADRLDAADVLNLANGSLDLNTLRLRPHDRRDLLTYCLPYEYGPAADAPHWDIVMERIEPATADFLQEYAGYSLTPDCRYEIALWLYGPPGRGASTMLAGWQAMLGAKATLLGLADIERNQFALSGLPGKTLAVATEQPADYIKTTNVVNALISGEPVKVDRKFKEAVDIVTRVKLAWAMNELPRVKGANDGIFRRVKVVTFPAIPEHERRPELKEAVKTEAAGILNWALAGLQRLRARGRFVIPATVEAASRKFAESNDIPAAFIVEQCYTGPEYKAQSQTLYNAYQSWCLATGHKPQSLMTIAGDWERLGFEKVKEPAGMFWHGVGLKAAESV